VSGIGNGYLSGNMLIPFPFEDGQCLAWPSESAEVRNEMQEALQRCFVDAGIYVDSTDVDQESCWPSIGDFSIDGNSFSFKVGICNGQDVNLSIPLPSTGFPVASGSAAWGSYVVVLSAEGISRFWDTCEKASIYPPPAQSSSSRSGRDGGYLRICAKCISFKSACLDSIMVYDGNVSEGHTLENGPHFVMSGKIDIRPGNNMKLLEPDNEGDNGFELSAEPGAGLGKCECVCGETAEGNDALAGPDGHCRIFNDSSFDIEPHEKYVENGVVKQKLTIHSKTSACCTCKMYQDIVNERLVPLAEAVRKAKSDLSGMLLDYEDAVRRFNNRISEPKLEDVTMTLSGMPIGKNVSPDVSEGEVSGYMSRCAFTAVIRNSSYAKMILTVTSISGTGNVVEASAAWSNGDGEPLSKTGDSKSSVVNTQFLVFPGRSLVITYIVSKDVKVKSVTTGGFTSSVYVNVSYQRDDGTGRYLGKLSKISRA